MQYPPIESVQAQFPLSPVTDSGPYYSPLPWYGSQGEGVGDFSTLPYYDSVEDNGWSYEPFSWFDSAKRDCVPSVCNEFQQQEGNQYGTDAFTPMIDPMLTPMLTAIATNYNGAPFNQPSDTNVTQRKRRDSGYESGTITFSELSSAGELEETDGPDYCQAELAGYVPPGYLHQFRLSRAPKLSITESSHRDGDIPRDQLLRFKLGRPEPAINASTRKTKPTPISSTIQRRPRKPPTKTPKPKPTSQTINEQPKFERALHELQRSLRSQAIAHEQAARHAWLLSCHKLLYPLSQLPFPTPTKPKPPTPTPLPLPPPPKNPQLTPPLPSDRNQNRHRDPSPPPNPHARRARHPHRLLRRIHHHAQLRSQRHHGARIQKNNSRRSHRLRPSRTRLPRVCGRGADGGGGAEGGVQEAGEAEPEGGGERAHAGGVGGGAGDAFQAGDGEISARAGGVGGVCGGWKDGGREVMGGGWGRM